MPVIYLIGPRACGKTTIGKTLARDLHAPFIDTDAALQEQEGRTIAEITEQEGWPAFRQKESNILKQVTQAASNSPITIIATGGGIILSEENRCFMRNNGVIIFLQAPIDILVSRLTKNMITSQRPSLTGAGIIQEVEKIVTERLPIYKQTAHHIVDATLPPHSLSMLIRRFVRRP